MFVGSATETNDWISKPGCGIVTKPQSVVSHKKPGVLKISRLHYMTYNRGSVLASSTLSYTYNVHRSRTPPLIPEAVFTGECPTSSKDILHTDHRQLAPRIEHHRPLFPSRNTSDLLARLDRPQASERASVPHKDFAFSPFLVLPPHPRRPRDCCRAIGNEISVPLSISLPLLVLRVAYLYLTPLAWPRPSRQS